MFLSLEQSDSLKNYLLSQLTPICDADPLVLAEYALALLKHDLPLEELREVCMNQLKDFLGEGGMFRGF